MNLKNIILGAGLGILALGATYCFRLTYNLIEELEKSPLIENKKLERIKAPFDKGIYLEDIYETPEKRKV